MISINMDMPKCCWNCIFGTHDLGREDTMCVLLFRLRNDIWNMPDRMKKGEKHKDCPLKEVK